MQQEKTIDCLKLKDAVQSKILKEHHGMNNEEVRGYIQRQLASSNTPVARLWRAIQKQERGVRKNIDRPGVTPG